MSEAFTWVRVVMKDGSERWVHSNHPGIQRHPLTTIREHLEAAVALEGEWPEIVFGEILDHVHAALKLLDGTELEVERRRS